jgi:hypothetical protein
MDPDQPAQPRSLIRNHADQTARMRRLVWIHAGRKRTMLVLSWRGSNALAVWKKWEKFLKCI